MTSIGQINQYCISAKEGRKLEFKEAKNSYNFEKLCEYCVALANECGGIFILGISDEIPRTVVGSNAFRDIAETEKKLLDSLRFSVKVEEVNHPNGRVVLFHIPSRPMGSAYSYKGRFLMRVGESLESMTDDCLRKIHAEAKEDFLEEEIMTGISDQDIIDLLDTQGFFELLERPYPSTRQGVIEALINKDLIDKSPSGDYSIRKIGALLLAKDLSKFGLQLRAPRVIVYNGRNKLSTKIDKPGQKGYAVGFDGLIKFIMEQLPQNEIVTSALREHMQLVPETVIRELVANALVHQDFSVTGIQCLVEIYDDRIEISNPGIPILEVDRFIDENKCRNERLAELLRLMRICEAKGSGWDKIVFAVEAYQLAAPDFRVSNYKTSVVISGTQTFEQMSKPDKIRACYQHVALKYVMNEPATNQTLRERFKLSEAKTSSVSQVISYTSKEEMIKVDEAAGGGRKFARYLPYWA